METSDHRELMHDYLAQLLYVLEIETEESLGRWRYEELVNEVEELREVLSG